MFKHSNLQMKSDGHLLANAFGVIENHKIFILCSQRSKVLYVPITSVAVTKINDTF